VESQDATTVVEEGLSKAGTTAEVWNGVPGFIAQLRRAASDLA